MTTERYDAVVFDLLTALIDSWTFWADVAGDAQTGRRWRDRYLRLTYGAGNYVPYESLVRDAARAEGLNPELADQLRRRWTELQPWPETWEVLAEQVSPMPKLRSTRRSQSCRRDARSRPGIGAATAWSVSAAGRIFRALRTYGCAAPMHITPFRPTPITAHSRRDTEPLKTCHPVAASQLAMSSRGSSYFDDVDQVLEAGEVGRVTGHHWQRIS